jgi:heme oxygenase
MEISDFQKKLKEETKVLHSKAENHPVMQSFVTGTFKKDHLLRFLVNTKPLYEVVEQRLLQQYILNNPDLERSTKLQKDIDLLKRDFTNEQLEVLLKPAECTGSWVGRCWLKPVELLKAELYVRWLADLYGGRMMANSLGEYTNTLQFDSPKKAIEDIRHILDIPNIVVSEVMIIEDTLKFFDYHVELFTLIENE